MLRPFFAFAHRRRRVAGSREDTGFEGVAFAQQKDAKCTCPLAFLSSGASGVGTKARLNPYMSGLCEWVAPPWEDWTPEFSCQQFKLELQTGRAGSKGNPI